MENNYTLKDVILLLWKHKMKIIIATILAGLISAGVSLLMDNYYKASTIFYPAGADLSNPQKILRGVDDIQYYGTGDDVDRLFSIGESRPLFDTLIDHFNLMERYEVNPEKSKARFITKEKLLKLYEIKKTERDAIEITIEDTDPEMAAKMANFARDYIESIARRVTKEQQRGLLKMLQANIDSQEKDVRILADSLANTRNKYSIFNKGAQTQYYSTEIPKTEALLAKTKGELAIYQNDPSGRFRDSILVKKADIQGLKQKLNILTRDKDGQFGLNSMKRGITTLDEVGASYFSILAQFNQTIKVMEEVKNSLEANGRAIVVIETALPPEEKSRPRRSLIVLASMFITGAVAKLFILGRHAWNAEFSHG